MQLAKTQQMNSDEEGGRPKRGVVDYTLWRALVTAFVATSNVSGDNVNVLVTRCIASRAWTAAGGIASNRQPIRRNLEERLSDWYRA